MEPWDGPAGLIFTDGVGVGAALDRNGLRPLRYAICEDGLVVCSSEVGAVDVSGHGKVERGRLGPGQMLFVDPTRGVQRNDDVKERLAAANTFSHWAHDGFLSFGPGEPVQQVDRGASRPARPSTATPRRSCRWSCGRWAPRARSPPSRWATTRPCRRWPAGPVRCTTT